MNGELETNSSVPSVNPIRVTGPVHLRLTFSLTHVPVYVSDGRIPQLFLEIFRTAVACTPDLALRYLRPLEGLRFPGLRQSASRVW